MCTIHQNVSNIIVHICNNGNSALDGNQLWSENRTKLGSLLALSEDTKDGTSYSALDGYIDGILGAKLGTVNGDVLESDDVYHLDYH